MKIFLADDDFIIRKGIRTILEKSNPKYSIIGEAQDGEEALEKIKELDSIDLLITDIKMPIMDGLELIKELRAYRDTIKIIVLSGFDDFKYVRSAFKDGAVDYVLKPINKKSLIELVEKIDSCIQIENQEKLQIEKGSNLILENLLKKLMNRLYVKFSDCENDVSSFGIKSNKYYAVLIFELDINYEKLNKVEEVNIARLLEDLYSRITFIENHEAYFEQAFKYIEKQQIVILYNGITNQESLDYIIQKYKMIMECCKRGEVTYSIGISDLFSELDKCYIAYDQAVKSLNYRFYRGGGEIIKFNEVDMKNFESYFNIDEYVKSISDNIEILNFSSVRSIINELFDKLRKDKIDSEEFRDIIEEICEKVIFTINDLQEIFNEREYNYKFHIREITTIDELNEYINTIFRTALEDMKIERDKRSKKRIEIAKAYINNNFMNNITLNEVAEHVQLNTSYFSNLFKKESGMNFSDYLLNIRLKRAKRLLRDPTIRVYEVGTMVGYEDAVSFGRAFKKKVGMSPKEYRNTVS
ncbi:response regulator transcription factor [Clostridium chromiireducens]|uniref:response regulator transcription factor n=1 Tax=Clostridium chromiireducens TaxID=225345 RepID=UPI003AF4DB53